MTLEEVYVGIHSTSCRGTHRSASHAFRRFCRTCIVDGVIFDILRQVFAPVEPFFEFGVRDVPTDDNRSVERQTCGNGIFIQLFENFAHRLVEVYFNGVAFTGLAEFFGNEFAGVTVEFLDPNTVLVDLHLMFRSAEQLTPNPTGQDAPWRGRRIMRTSCARYLPPNCAPSPIRCASSKTCFPTRCHGKLVRIRFRSWADYRSSGWMPVSR